MGKLNGFSRLSEEKEGVSLPSEWIDEVVSILNQTYEDFCLNNSRAFKCYAESYPEELLVIASIVNPIETNKIPITFSLSVDLRNDSSKEMKKLLDSSINIIGNFIDIYIATESWDEFCSNWTYEEKKKFKFFYTVSRENIELTLEADKLLKSE